MLDNGLDTNEVAKQFGLSAICAVLSAGAGIMVVQSLKPGCPFRPWQAP